MANMTWSKSDTEFLIENYPQKGLYWCVVKLNKSAPSIREKCSRLKLKQDRSSQFFKEWQNRARISKIGKKRPDQSLVMKKLWKDGKLERTPEMIEEFTKRMSTQWKIKPHPRGMLGKTHSNKVKLILSKKFKEAWANPKSKFNTVAFRQKMSDRASKNMQYRIQTKGSVYSRSKNGWYVIAGKRYYFRSGWEVVYARYLEWLLNKGEIKSWEYEPETFWFENIRRGVRSYTPDFRIVNKNDLVEFHEVKGWMDSKSKTKIKRIAKYYPNIKLIVIEKNAYKSVCKYEKMFPEAIKELQPVAK